MTVPLPGPDRCTRVRGDMLPVSLPLPRPDRGAPRPRTGRTTAGRKEAVVARPESGSRHRSTVRPPVVLSPPSSTRPSSEELLEKSASAESAESSEQHRRNWRNGKRPGTDYSADIGASVRQKGFEPPTF